MFEGCDRRFQQAAVPTRLDEPCEQLGVARVIVGATKQPQHRCFGLPELDFNISIEVVRDSQIRVQLQGSRERRLRLFVVIVR